MKYSVIRINAASILLILIILGSSMMSAAAKNINVLRSNSPDPSIALVDLTPGDQGMLLEAQLPDLPSVCFWLDNRSDRSIMGIAATWSITGQDGKVRKMQFTVDSYLDKLMRPISAPHTRLLIAPRMWIPESMVPDLIQKEYFTQFQWPRIRRTISEMTEAKSVSVSIDAVIFSDGQVVGPNQTKFDTDLLGRKSASQIIVGIVQAAGNQQAAKEQLQQLVSQPVPTADRSIVWQHRFGQQLLHSPDFAQTLDYIEHLPPPPTFYGNISKTVSLAAPNGH